MFGLFCYFSVLFSFPFLEEANSVIFSVFLLIFGLFFVDPPEKFYADENFMKN